MLVVYFLLFYLAALGTSFRVPNGTTNGLYKAYYDDTGSEVHEKIPLGELERAQGNMPEPSKRAADSAADSYYTWCGCGIHLVTADCAGSVTALAAQFGSNGATVNSGQSFYSIQNNVVAFACNPEWANGAIATSSDVWIFAGKITEFCGESVPGTAYSGDEIYGGSKITRPIMGYMATGQNFCANAEGSHSTSC